LRWFVIAVEDDGVSDHRVSIPISNLFAFDRWLKDIDKTAATGWRWRKLGWIKTVNICGRIYVDRREIARFEEAAAAGEFSKIHKTPKRK
jgi:hypothetical protein